MWPTIGNQIAGTKLGPGALRYGLCFEASPGAGLLPAAKPMVKSEENRPFLGLPQRVWDGLGLLVLAFVLAALVWRQSHIVAIDGEVQRSAELGRDGLADFRDVIHYPLVAVREKVNPYDSG